MENSTDVFDDVIVNIANTFNSRLCVLVLHLARLYWYIY